MADCRPTSPLELASSLDAERDDVLRSVAALQLMPENASKWMRFERLIEAAAGTVPGGEPRSVSTRRNQGRIIALGRCFAAGFSISSA